MGKRHVRSVVVRKPVTVALLLLLSVAMAGLLYALSGRAYAVDRHPMLELAARLLGAGAVPVSRSALLAMMMPVLANVMLFVPWGFLAFVALDSKKRSRRSAYMMTIAGALVFAAALYAWQTVLPTRVTAVTDALANALGAFAGAALGHLRKGVRIQFDF